MLFKAGMQNEGWKVSWKEEVACFAASCLLLSYILCSVAIPGCSKNRTCSSRWDLFSFQPPLPPGEPAGSDRVGAAQKCPQRAVGASRISCPLKAGPTELV